METNKPITRDSKDDPIDFASVLHEELGEINRLRERRQWKHGNTETSAVAPAEIFKAAHKKELVGLAFSGGGIRSATFNLGILQGFAKLGLLPMFDYLSTVSGGGYIGSWFEAWIYRAGKSPELTECLEPPAADDNSSPIRRVQECLKPDRSAKPQQAVPRPIRFLREYSNYLTPRLGFLGGDTWTAVAIYLRNLLLNQLILALFLASVLLVPYIAVWISSSTGEWTGPHSSYIGIGLAVLLVVLSQVFAACNMRNLTGHLSEGKIQFPFYAQQGWILALTAAPLFVAAWIISVWLWANPKPSWWLSCAESSLPGDWPWLPWALFGALGFGLAWAIAALFNLPESGPAAPHWNSTSAFSWSLFYSLISGSVGGLLLRLLANQIFTRWSSGNSGLWYVVSFGTPLVGLVFLIVGVLQIGLMGLYFPDPRREWWGRLGGFLLILSIIWAAAFALAIYSPLGLMWLKGWVKGLGIAWIGTTLAGILGGKSASTSGLGRRSWKDTALSITPYVFIVGILAVLAWFLELALALLNGVDSKTLSDFLAGSPVAQKVGGWVVALDYSLSSHSVHGTITSGAPSAQSSGYIQAHWIILNSTLHVWLLPLLGVVLAVCFFLSWRVNLNEFSMNLFYRNRLVRAYLGASHSDRHPNPFSGLDPADDLHLKDLRSDQCYSGPFPIINTTLNLVAGKDLAWQERKAASFIFTPFRCGFDTWLEQIDLEQGAPMPPASGISRYGYRPSERFLYDYPANAYKDSGPRLGTAISISGAAASPNMGYHSSSSLAFLMTFFDVRLGFWAGNPRHTTTWTKPGPRIGLFHLLKELFAQTDDEAGYVYLSDGGHFENLGLYELVKRRCKFVVVSDAGCDDAYAFGDLGNAIRKCREDIGVEIELVTTELTPKPVCEGGQNDRFSKWHWAIGKIHYNLVDREAEDGILVYLKASLTGDEPADVLNYHRQHPDFPHQTTADQWFTESQFESYRRLGQHVVLKLFAGISVAEPNTGDIFANLEAKWRANSPD
jgi:hypothetical protein